MKKFLAMMMIALTVSTMAFAEEVSTPTDLAPVQSEVAAQEPAQEIEAPAAEEEQPAVEEKAETPVVEEPAAEEKTAEEAPVVEEAKAERSVTIQLVTGSSIYVGDRVGLQAVLTGYEGVDCSFQWQSKTENGKWQNVDGATSDTLWFEMTEELDGCQWRVVVTTAD